MTTEMAAPVISAGFASGTSTLQIISRLLAPIDCAASITPTFTSLRELSTMRATYGAAATISITITALLPIIVPTRNFATGSIATIRMMNGMLRKKLTTKPSTLLSFGCGAMPFLSVTFSITPRGRPIR